MGMKKHAWTVLLGVGFCACCCAAGLEETYSLPNGISFSLPSNWEMIPEDVLQELKKMSAEADSDTSMALAKVDVALQRSGAESWFAYPYVSIYINQEGRIGEEALAQRPQVPWNNLVFGDLFEQDPVSLLCNTNSAFEYFDPDTASVYMLQRSSTDLSGEVVGLSVIRLTKTGFVMITCSFMKEQSAELQHLCAEIAASLTIPSEMKYQFDEYTYRLDRYDRPASDVDTEADNFGQWFVPFCAMLGGSIAGVILKRKNRKKVHDQTGGPEAHPVMTEDEYVNEWKMLWPSIHPVMAKAIIIKEMGTIQTINDQRCMMLPVLTSEQPAVELLRKVKAMLNSSDITPFLNGDIQSTTGTLGRYIPPDEICDHVSFFVSLKDGTLAMVDLGKEGVITGLQRFNQSERGEVEKAFYPVDKRGCPLGVKVTG